MAETKPDPRIAVANPNKTTPAPHDAVFDKIAQDKYGKAFDKLTAAQADVVVNVRDADAATAAEAKTKADADAAAELDFIAQPFILSPEMGKISAPQRARDDKQVKMDATVAKLHEKWVKAGRPSTWGAMVNAGTVATYFIAPENASAHKKLITRAAQIPDSGMRIRWGKSYPVTAQLAGKYNLPPEYVGREVVSFAVMDRRTAPARGSKKDATAAQTDAMIPGASGGQK
jgi:hypothetical protein